ncbi:PREDICTED: uncharacterized protein LOC106109031 [Papilio polytes]|uniref:uncharacterized protein LOC106109031 n=1 Tax=Papilio polytes TaxID=76194 RepID=UPI000675C10A|nr:PREDICTED: uncharacterized protein LOC106109031 [Papilio polytes]
MRIPGCKMFLEKEVPCRQINLNGRRVVVDGQNFFYAKYEDFKLEFRFGSECDKYAEFLRGELQAFQRAGITCLFVFKGGHNKMPRRPCAHLPPAPPLLASEVHKQLLDEMGFEYTVCDYTANDDCVALARSLHCPILANNVEYFFAGIQYIPYTNLNYSTVRANQYELNSLLTKYKIDNKQVATFLALFDVKVFNLETLENLLRRLHLPLSYAKRIDSFLRWLGHEGQCAATLISRNLATDDRNKLQSEIERKLENVVEKRSSGGLAAQYFLDRDRCRIGVADPEWFEKGVALKFIPIPYINIYRWRIVEVYDNDDPLLVAAPIIRYAFDLLTNFCNEKILVKIEPRQPQSSEGVNIESCPEASIEIVQSVRRPNYGSGNVFENGWNDIGSFKLFEHFLWEILGISEWGRLERAPDDARLVVVALVYAARLGGGAAARGVTHAALLCHALLAAPGAGPRSAARLLMDTYLCGTDEDVEQSVLVAVQQLQHCLRHINFLNVMCGSPLPPTLYSSSFNATFVYRAARGLRGEHPPPPAAPPALRSYLDNILDIYEHFLNFL